MVAKLDLDEDANATSPYYQSLLIPQSQDEAPNTAWPGKVYYNKLCSIDVASALIDAYVSLRGHSTVTTIGLKLLVLSDRVLTVVRVRVGYG